MVWVFWCALLVGFVGGFGFLGCLVVGLFGRTVGLCLAEGLV